ncbi:MAG: heat-inducible transcription repressor HrcA [Clostridia bacterium]|nr:heat-inducible transcription repressor HrcA [Clostridia bacterium]
MDERKRRVLQAIVDDYIMTAEPVGSRTIARKYKLGVSPATIRNEMADLEELGYLEQPHTSAGRVPSDKGYRYYVDFLLPPETLSEEDVALIEGYLAARAREVEATLRQAVRILSSTSDNLAVVTGPHWGSSVLRSLQLIRLRDDKVLLVLVTEEGLVHSSLVEVDTAVAPEELTAISRVLTSYLGGNRVADLRAGVLRELRDILGRYGDLLSATLDEMSGMGGEGGERLYVDGAAHLLRQPEFRNVEKLYRVLHAVEQESLIASLLSRWSGGEGVRVLIGEELEADPIQDCSLIVTTYGVGGRTFGHVAVIGPRRMAYARTIRLVEYVGRSLSGVLGTAIS